MTAVVNNSGLGSESNDPPKGSTSHAWKQSKTMVAPGKADGSRKQGNAASESTQRRMPPTKAWSGMNPITQRSSTPTASNGLMAPSRHGPAQGESEGLDDNETPHQRLLFLMANAMGTTANITMANGDVYSGIFAGALLEKTDPEYLLKMVQCVAYGEKNEANGIRENLQEYLGVGDDHSMTFKFQDTVDLSFGAVSIPALENRANGSSPAFRTDADISGKKFGQERELQPWVAPEGADTGHSLEQSANSGPWDQFKANESLFGVKSDYDENIYTSSINTSHPEYRERLASASRMAQKIEKNMKVEPDDGDGEDEEDKFSGVRRQAANYPPLQSTQPNRYQPPALRPPTGRPTVPGAPVDPAIISAQLGRPDAGGNRKQEVAPKQNVEGDKTMADEAHSSSKTAETTANGSISKGANKVDTTSNKTGKPAVLNASINAESEALKAFRQFSEKQKIRVADDRRQRVIHDKAVKLNDLRGFSKNFKLNCPIPRDLVPILAKDPRKREEILQKSQHKVVEQASSSAKSTAQGKGETQSTPASEAKRENISAGTIDQADLPRQVVPPRGPQASLPLRERQQQQAYAIPSLPPTEPGFAQRLAKNQRDRQSGITSNNVPPPLPLHAQKTPSRSNTNAPRVASSQGSAPMRTPTSSTSGKFNVKAHEFVPNPAASSFQPTADSSNAPSPRGQGKSRSTSQLSTADEFFGRKKPLPAEKRPSILEHFNPIKRLKDRAEKDGKAKDYVANGGIPFAHATPVTWTVLKDGEEGKSYKEMFDDISDLIGISPRPMTASPMNQNVPHPQHLPPHLAHGPHGTPLMQGQAQNMYPGPPQPWYPSQHLEDQRLHSSPSAYSTPRMQNAYGPYPVPSGQPLQGPLPAGFPYPVLGGGHPQVINPGAPPPGQYRPYGPVPQYLPVNGQPLAAPVMVQQGSQGPYMPQGAPVGTVPVYPGGVPFGPSQSSNGYPSPGRGAPLMMHQGSMAGHSPQGPVMPGHFGQAQPFYAPQGPHPNMGHMRGYPSPQPHYPYPSQPQRIPSTGYGVGNATQAPMHPAAHGTAPADGSEGMK